MNATVRKIEARDRSRWQESWEGYCKFYDVDLRGLYDKYTPHSGFLRYVIRL